MQILVANMTWVVRIHLVAQALAASATSLTPSLVAVGLVVLVRVPSAVKTL